MSTTYRRNDSEAGAIPVGTVIKTTSTADGQVQHVNVDSNALPTGAATAALQTTLNGYYSDTVEDRAQTPTKTKAINVQIGPGDVISNIPVTITYEHHQVHEGESHEYNYLISSLASGSNQDFRVNVPAGLTATTRAPHVIFEVISTLEAELYLYEDMTYTVGNGGTLQTTYNRNRSSATTPGMTIYLSPTPATTGNNLWIGLVGSGRAAGGEARGMTEWVLKPNADYLFRVTSRAAGNKIVVRLIWYEDLGV